MSKNLKAPLWARVINLTLLILLCFTIILPFMHILALAFNQGKDAQTGGIYFLPRVFSLENFKEVFKQKNLFNGLKISIFRTLIGTGASMVLMSMAAYALTIKSLPGKKFISFFIFFTMLFSGGVIPYYVLLTKLKLTNNIWVYIIPSLYSVTHILILRTSFNQLPYSVIEAARIDGCSEFNIFRRIVIPMSKPVLATITLFQAVGHWNDWYSGTFFVRSSNLKPLATLLQEMLTRQQMLSDIILKNAGSDGYRALEKVTVTGQSLQMATIIVVILPIILVYPFIQKYFVKGITIGSIKE